MPRGSSDAAAEIAVVSSFRNVPVPADYVLGPGDEIDLKLWGAVDADLRLAVDRNGQINIPRVGTINVAGLRASQLEQTLRPQIGRVYNNFQLSATLSQLRSIQVFVVGQAHHLIGQKLDRPARPPRRRIGAIGRHQQQLLLI